jgi:hypothetical protein
MNSIKSVIIIISILIFCSLPPHEALANYLQGQCVSGDGYFSVNFPIKANERSVDLIHKQGISIQKPALSMRYPPTYYAVLWKDIVSISFFDLKDKSNEGILIINFKGLFWGTNADELGLIDRPCWEDLSKFIRLNDIKVTVDSGE